jgi:hypothetical protein
MHIAQTRLSIATAPREIKEITAEVARWTERQRISVGLLTLYIPHTSAPQSVADGVKSPSQRPGLLAWQSGEGWLGRVLPAIDHAEILLFARGRQFTEAHIH